MQTVFAEVLFHQRLAESHVNTAFGFTFDERRIEGTATVVGDLNFIDLISPVALSQCSSTIEK